MSNKDKIQTVESNLQDLFAENDNRLNFFVAVIYGTGVVKWIIKYRGAKDECVEHLVEINHTYSHPLWHLAYKLNESQLQLVSISKADYINIINKLKKTDCWDDFDKRIYGKFLTYDTYWDDDDHTTTIDMENYEIIDYDKIKTQHQNKKERKAMWG